MEKDGELQLCTTFKKRSLSESYLKDCGVNLYPYRKISVDDSYLILTNQNGCTKENSSEECERNLVEYPCLNEVCQSMPSIPSINYLGLNEMHPYNQENSLDINQKLADASKLPYKDSRVNITLTSCGSTCRICLEGDGQEELISPCKCSGTLGLIHKSCLEKWLNLTHCDRCELCRYVFTVTRTPKPCWQLRLCSYRELRRSMAVDFLCFLIFTPLVAMSLYLCISAVMFYEEHFDKIKEMPPHLQPSHIKPWNVKGFERDNKNITDKLEGRDPQDFGPAWDVIGLAFLAMILVCMYIFWLSAAGVYYTRILKIWRHASQAVELSENHRRPSHLSGLNESNAYQQMDEDNTPVTSSPTGSPYRAIPRINVVDTDLQNY